MRKNEPLFNCFVRENNTAGTWNTSAKQILLLMKYKYNSCPDLFIFILPNPV